MLPRLFYSISAKTAACSALYSHRSPAVLGRGLGNRIFRPGNIKPAIPVAGSGRIRCGRRQAPDTQHKRIVNLINQMQ